MANLTINNGGIVINSTDLPNIDLRYGPYKNISEAYRKLGSTITPGLTIGIIEEGGIREYIVNDDNQLTPKLKLKTINDQPITGEGNINIEGITDYSQLSNKPSINGNELNGNIDTSQLGIDIPTKTSDLVNDSGFLTTETEFNSSPAKTITTENIIDWNGKQDELTSGTNIKTINNQSILGSGNISIEGITDYSQLSNKPKINNIELGGNVSLSDLGVATETDISELADKVDKLPTGRYYGQYDSIEELPDQSQLPERGYAYVSSTEPNVYYIYLYNGNGEEWQDSGNKFVTTELESNLTTKSQTKAPTTKAVADGIDSVNLLEGKNLTTSQKTTARENIGAQETLSSGDNIKTINNEPVLGTGNIIIQDITTPRTSSTELTITQKYNASANINDRPVDEVIETGVVRALGYKILNPELTFASQVQDANTIYEIRDEFDLASGNVTLPSGCTLKFNGGRVVNGSITDADEGGNFNVQGLSVNNGVFISGYNIPADNKEEYLDARSIGMIDGSDEYQELNGNILDKVIATKKWLTLQEEYYIKCPNENGYYSIDYNLKINGNGTIRFIRSKSATTVIFYPVESEVVGQYPSFDFNNVTIYADDRNLIGRTAKRPHNGGTEGTVDFLIDHIVFENCKLHNTALVRMRAADVDYSQKEFGLNRFVVKNCKITDITTPLSTLTDFVVAKEYLISGNNIDKFVSLGFMVATTNTFTKPSKNKKYQCDFIIENNVVTGKAYQGTSYYTFIQFETRRVFYRNNIVSNVISMGLEQVSYDAYCSCDEYYCENNVFTNIVRSNNPYLSTIAPSEIFKSKAGGNVRVARGNRWYINFDECVAMTKEVSWDPSDDYPDDDYPGISKDMAIFNFTGKNQYLEFTDNVIEIKGGCLEMSPSSTPLVEAIINRNVFKVDTTTGALVPYYNNIIEKIEFCNNTIQVSDKSRFNVVCGYQTTSESDIVDVRIENNISNVLLGLPTYCKRVIFRNNIISDVNEVAYPYWYTTGYYYRFDSKNNAYIQLTEKNAPDDWKTNYMDYFTKSNDVYSEVSWPFPTWEENKYYSFDNDSGEYTLTTGQPNDWKTNYMDYFTKSGDEYYSVSWPFPSWEENKYYRFDNYILVTKEPRYWDTNYKEYFTKNGDEYYQVSSNSTPTWEANKYYRSKYTLTTERPSDWGTNYMDYFTKSGIVYSKVSWLFPSWEENKYYSFDNDVYTLTTEEPSNWKTNYKDYFTKSGDVYYSVSWPFPSWEENKYYSFDKYVYTLTTRQPSDWKTNYMDYYTKIIEYSKVSSYSDWEENKYYSFDNDSGVYTLTTEEPNDWGTNYMDYYFIGNVIYSAVSSDSTPTWEANKYYRLDNDVYTLTTERPSDWGTNYMDYYIKSGYFPVTGKNKCVSRGIIYTYKPIDSENSYIETPFIGISDNDVFNAYRYQLNNISFETPRLSTSDTNYYYFIFKVALDQKVVIELPEIKLKQVLIFTNDGDDVYVKDEVGNIIDSYKLSEISNYTPSRWIYTPEGGGTAAGNYQSIRYNIYKDRRYARFVINNPNGKHLPIIRVTYLLPTIPTFKDDSISKGVTVFNSGKPNYWNGKDWVGADGIADSNRKGTTANRPTNPPIGFCYYDTDFNRPTFWRGDIWTDASGQPLEIFVSDSTILLGATEGSMKTVSVYYPGTTIPTITTLNSDESPATWLTAEYTLFAPKFALKTYYSSSHKLLTEEPSDWETNYMNYFTKSGDVYSAVEGVVKNEVVFTASSNTTTTVAPEWDPSKEYYSKSGNNYTKLTEEPSNWKTSYMNYFTKSGDVYSAVEGVQIANDKPRGAKALVRLGEELVIVNIIQNYI